jgi:hypothetical protein
LEPPAARGKLSQPVDARRAAPPAILRGKSDWSDARLPINVRRDPQRWHFRRIQLRFGHAVLISCLLHGLILSMKFDLPGLGSPGSIFSKADRRAGDSSLNVTIVARSGKAAQRKTNVSPSRARENATKLARKSPSPMMTPRQDSAARAVEAPIPYKPDPTPEVAHKQAMRVPRPVEPLPPKESIKPPPPAKRIAPEPAFVAKVADNAPNPASTSRVETQRLEALRQETLRQEAAAQIAAVQEAARREALQQQEQLRQEAVRQEAVAQAVATQEAIQREVLRQEILRQEVLRQDALREEAAAQAAARQESAQREALRQEALRQEAAEQAAARAEASEREAVRQEALRQEEAAAQAAATQDAIQRETARQESLRQEAAAQAATTQEAAQREALRQEAMRLEAAAQAAATQEAAQREALRQEALGQEALHREATAQGAKAEGAPAAQRPAAPAASAAKIDQPAVIKLAAKPPEARLESAKRRTLVGRPGPDQDLRVRMLAEGWRQKIEQNAPLELLHAAKDGPYQNPVVTVALRRDGSVESVVINRSSGVAAIDDAVRQIVYMLSPYTPFPSDVGVDYDIIEVRRVWTFDVAVRLLYGGR